MATFGVMEGLAVAGAVMSAATTMIGGAQANQQAKAQSKVMEQQARQERAAAAQDAQRKRQEVDFLSSKQQAAAAASGGGASDPTIIDLMSDTAAEGETQARTIRGLGDIRATDIQNQAAFTRYRGQQAQSGAYLKAGGTLAGGAASLYSKYGGGDDPGLSYADAQPGSYGAQGSYLGMIDRRRLLGGGGWG